LQTFDGQWLPVEVPPNALVCNIGDCMQRWSNDIYRSTPHRVINSSGHDRYSIAVFGDVDGDTTISTIPSCVTADRPAVHEPIVFSDYAAERFATAYGKTS
jgi:isopenicillin N synthase-like dioxygenase